MSPEINREDIQRLKGLLTSARTVALVGHLAPDGDALGSTLGMAYVLRGMGKDARVFTPDEPPHYLRVLPGARDIMAFSSFGEKASSWIRNADVVLCMDFNATYRVSRLQPAIENVRGKRVLIDHHENPEHFADLSFSFPPLSSTSELTAHLLKALGWWNRVDTDAATCLMGGIITDTGGFRYNSSMPCLYLVVADLLGKGVNKDRLVRCLVSTTNESAMRLESYALAKKMEVFHDARAALIVLTRDELNSYGYKKGDTEGLVNRPLEIPGIVYSCYLRQEPEYVKVSMRSLADFPVNLLCSRHYGGGGHLNAAGGEFRGTMEECIQLFKDNLQENLKLMSPAALKAADR